MLNTNFKMRAKVWLYPGLSAWHFITLPKKDASKIKSVFGSMHRGWGSIPVNVTIGKTTWKTSIFWDKKSSSYLLPLKSEVRKKENIKAADNIAFIIDIRI